MEKYNKIEKHNEFKILTPTWNDKFELPDGSDSASDNQIHLKIRQRNTKY